MKAGYRQSEESAVERGMNKVRGELKGSGKEIMDRGDKNTEEQRLSVNRK